VSFYPVYSCPDHAERAVAAKAPLNSPFCGWAPLGEWPCPRRLVIIRWVYDPAERDPKPRREWTIWQYLAGVAGIWCVLFFGALCIWTATR
jgi:hypothetical protein